MTGAQSWTQGGKEEHARGEGEYKAAQAKGYVEGATDTVGGYKDSVVGAVAGDKTQQATGKFGFRRALASLMRACRKRQEGEGPGATGSKQTELGLVLQSDNRHVCISFL